MKKIYKQQLLKKAVYRMALFLGVLLWGSISSFAQSYDLPIQGGDVVRCGAGELTLEVEWSGESLDPNNVKWYTEPFYGTPIATGLSYNTGYIEFTQTFFVDYIGDGGCGQCDRLMIRAVINDQAIDPQISYSNLVICNNLDKEFIPTIVGASSGSFSVSPSTGLSVNGTTGVFNPNGSTEGSYTITFDPVDVIGCNTSAVSTIVTISAALEEPVITYGDPANFCSTGDPVSVIKSAGADGGTYSSYPSGLTIDASTGTITPETSASGDYIVSYTVSGSGGCEPVEGTASVSIKQLPVITDFSYASPFCGSSASQELPTLIVENDYTPGANPYSYTAVTEGAILALNTSSGAIDPSGSDAGTYTITYTIPAATPCGEVTGTTSVEVYPVSAATISTDKTTEFVGEAAPVVTMTGSVGPAPYTFTGRLDIGSGEEIISGTEFEMTTANAETATVEITQSTEVAEVYTYHLLSVTDANGCTVDIENESVVITINDIPNVDFAYEGSPYCTNGGIATPSGSTSGAFSCADNNLDLNTETGEITLASSTAGTYVVTQTLNGYSSTAEVVISRLPNASFAYSAIEFCPTAGEVAPSSINDIGVFTADDPVVVFAEGEGVDPGTINTLFTPPGTYTITNTIQAANGCIEVSASTQITINASPNYTGNRAYSICSGETTSVIHDADIEGATFSWTVGAVSGSITGASDGSGSTIEQTLVNPSNTAAGTVEYIVTPSDASGCGDGIPTTVVVTVNPLPETPTAVDNTVVYDGTEMVAGASSTVIAGVEAAVINWYTTETGTTTTTSPTGTNVGTYTAWAEAKFESTGCISSGRTLVTLTITPRPLTASSTIDDKIYNGSSVTGTVNLGTVSNLVSGEDLSISASATDFANANAESGKSTTISYSLSDGTNGDASNYSMANLGTTGNILKKELTVTADAKTKVYGESNPALTYQYSGFVNSETSDVLTTEPTASTTVDATTDVGTHIDAITVSGGVDDNYSFTYVANDFTVTAVTITVTADDIIRGVGETTPAYSYTMTGFKNAETEAGLRTASSLSGTVTFTDNTSGSTAAGSYTITPVVTALAATNYTFTASNGTLTISNVVVESTGGTSRAGYSYLDAAYTAINAGTHTGDIVIHVYANTSETATATLNSSGTGAASYTSVAIVAENDVTITGTSSPLMILGN
ncbi:MBG domain-containing protein [uncultured Draconibacterium sp.]|uniref:MBG domain-containing protein n=1 Tax=uncultured Draconibacterium sp. TaxID=1573823 RepID=UPI0029C7EBE1|nr:MBG domain-containing protein [uncultured Draconibacterium sp.]